MLIGVIGGKPEIDEDNFDKRVILRILSYSRILGYDYIDANSFVKAMQRQCDKEVITTHDILTAFNELDEEKQRTIISECSSHSEHKSISYEFDNVVELSVTALHDFNTEEIIKSELKHCKHPLQRNQLERELNTIKYNRSKHKNNSSKIKH